MTTLRDIADACAQLPGGSEKWAGELLEALAKTYCKGRKDIPAWSKLTAAQVKMCRVQSERMLTAMVTFFQQKLDEEGE